MTDAKLAEELEEHRAIYGDNEPFTLPFKSWEQIIAALRGKGQRVAAEPEVTEPANTEESVRSPSVGGVSLSSAATHQQNAAGQVLEGAAHTDHPMRHYDRTCPACNPDAPNRIAIGQFILRQSDAHEDKVWIFTSGGEGGIFDSSKLADVIGDFYAENF